MFCLIDNAKVWQGKNGELLYVTLYEVKRLFYI